MPRDLDLLAALRRARIAVDQYIDGREALGHGYKEESATERLLGSATPNVRFVEFNRRQEAVVGADWLWWWVDRSDISFGLLAQAKCIRRDGPGWKLDLTYKDGEQMRTLLASAEDLKVPATFFLYAGTTARGGLSCGATHSDSDCGRCVTKAASVLPALIAQSIAGSNAFRPSGKVASQARCKRRRT